MINIIVATDEDLLIGKKDSKNTSKKPKNSPP